MEENVNMLEMNIKQILMNMKINVSGFVTKIYMNYRPEKKEQIYLLLRLSEISNVEVKKKVEIEFYGSQILEQSQIQPASSSQLKNSASIYYNSMVQEFQF